MNPTKFVARLRPRPKAPTSARAQPSPTERAVLACLGKRPHLAFGRLQSTGALVGLPRSSFFPSTHMSIRGHTGTGKSFFVLSLLLQLLGDQRVLVGDPKCELAGLVQLALAAVLSRQPRERAERFLAGSYTVLNPYGDAIQAHLNIMTPLRGRGPDEQAEDICRFLATALGDSFSFQMQRPVRQAALLFLELGRRFGGALSLLELKCFLASEPYRLGLLRWCEQQEVRQYFLHEFDRAPAASIGAVLVRLEALLADPRVRRTLCAPGFTDLASAAERACAIVTLPPGTSTTASNFFMPIFVSELTRSLLGRARTGNGPPTPLVACIDEWQLGVRDADGARAFSDLLTLARYAAVSLLLPNQHEQQLPGDELRESLENVGVQVAFRASSKEANRHAGNLPSDARQYVKRTPSAPEWDRQLESAEAARRRLATEHTRLPDRQCWLTLKKWGHPAVLLKTLDVDLDGLSRAADRLPPRLRALVEGQGTGSAPDALEAVVEARRAHMQLVAEGRASSPIPDFERGSRVVSTRSRPPPASAASTVHTVRGPTPPVSTSTSRTLATERSTERVPSERSHPELPNIGD